VAVLVEGNVVTLKQMDASHGFINDTPKITQITPTKNYGKKKTNKRN